MSEKEEVQNVQEEWHHVVTVEDIDKLKRRLHITYDAEGVDMAYSKACDLVGKRVQIKGYRKGKAPKALVKSYCKEQIKDSASSLLANEGFLHACFEQKIQPLGKPQIEKAEFSVNGTFSCSMVVDVKPTITPTGYVGMSLEKPKIDAEEIFTHMLDGAKVQYASIANKDVVEENDTAEVDFDAKCGDDEVAAGKGHHFEIRAGMEPPFGENLLGMKVGEVREANYLIPDNFRQHAGEQAMVNITLKAITTKVPPTDEELAERMQVSSYEDLIKLMKHQAQIEANNRERQTLEESIIDKLIESHEFDVPENWVEEEMQYIEKRFGVEPNDDEKFMAYVRQMAERNVRRAFILDAIYDAEPSLRVTPEEVEKVIEEEAERTNTSVLTIKDRLKKKNVMDSVLGMMRQRKVLSLILNQAQIVVEGESEQHDSESADIPENPLG